MPIINDTDDEIEVKDIDPVALNPEYESVAVDTARHDINSMLTHIEGSSWTVDYYSQMLGKDSEAQPLQLDLDPAYQQYTAVFNMELKVTSPLEFDMADDTGSMSATGSATVYPYLIPNLGDTFIAGTGDGRDGVFTVTNVERLTILKETAHRIDYSIVTYLNDQYRDNLKIKTIKETYFKREFLLVGQNPFLIGSDVQKIDTLQEHKRKLLGRYIKTFLSTDYSVLIEPHDTKKGIYDHFLAKAFDSVFSVEDHKLTRELKVMNCDGEPSMSDYTVWNCLLDMDTSLMPLVVKRMDVIKTRRFGSRPVISGSQLGFRTTPVYRGIAYSGIDYMYIPSDNQDDLEPMPDVGEPPLIHPPHSGGGYIFSRSFYNDEPGKSRLEIETLRAMNGESLSHETLNELANESINWDQQSQFFYIPVLLILIKVAERRL